MQRKAFTNEIATGIAVTLVGFAILEALLRIAYFVRNSMVDYIPLVVWFISSLTYFEIRQRICNELPDHFSSC